MNTLIFTQKNRLKLNSQKSEIIKQLCFYSARLYNTGLYSVRQYFFNENSYLPYVENYHECKENENYKLLLASTSQQILRIVDRNFKSFFALLQKQAKYNNKIQIPKYKKK